MKLFLEKINMLIQIHDIDGSIYLLSFLIYYRCCFLGKILKGKWNGMRKRKEKRKVKYKIHDFELDTYSENYKEKLRKKIRKAAISP